MLNNPVQLSQCSWFDVDLKMITFFYKILFEVKNCFQLKIIITWFWLVLRISMKAHQVILNTEVKSLIFLFFSNSLFYFLHEFFSQVGICRLPMRCIKQTNFISTNLPYIYSLNEHKGLKNFYFFSNLYGVVNFSRDRAVSFSRPGGSEEAGETIRFVSISKRKRNSFQPSASPLSRSFRRPCFLKGF